MAELYIEVKGVRKVGYKKFIVNILRMSTNKLIMECGGGGNPSTAQKTS